MKNLSDIYANAVLNLVLQKEYLIAEPAADRYVLGTESVRSCVAICIYHSSKSAILHWDDNTCHLELDKFIDRFLTKDIPLSQCTVSLIGGWQDHPESNKTALFLKEFFEQRKANLRLDHFLVKQSKSPLADLKSAYAAEGFSLVLLNSRTGEIALSSDWTKPILIGDDLCRGEHMKLRIQSGKFLDSIHYQTDEFPDSGTPIHCRDEFTSLSFRQANDLCQAAQTGDIPKLTAIVNAGIIDINQPPSNAKGWTPLHFACKLGKHAAARFLLENGASPLAVNNAGKKAFDLLKDPIEARKLKAYYRIVKFSTAQNPGLLKDFSLFARHPSRLEKATLDQIADRVAQLDDKEYLDEVERQLSSIPL